MAACATRRTCILTGDDIHIGAWRVNDGTNNVTIRGFVMTNFATPSTWPMGVVQARAGGLIETLHTEHGLVEKAANGILCSAKLEAIADEVGVPLLTTRREGRMRRAGA